MNDVKKGYRKEHRVIYVFFELWYYINCDFMNQYFDNNKKLVSNLVENKIKVLDTDFYRYTDNGVFNKKGFWIIKGCLL